MASNNEIFSNHGGQEPYASPFTGFHDHVTIDFPTTPDAPAFSPVVYSHIAGYGVGHGAKESGADFCRPIYNAHYPDFWFQQNQFQTEPPLPQNFPYATFPQHKKAVHDQAAVDGYTTEPLPGHTSPADWSSPFCSSSPLTPGPEIMNGDISMNGGYIPSRRPSFARRPSVPGDFGGTASPNTMDSPYSNSSYSGTIRSSQSNVSSPTASSGPLPLPPPPPHPPPPPPSYPRGGGNSVVISSQHEQNKQKNRAAAARCREKTRHYADELRGRERDLSSKKEFLTACVADLRDEILALKNEILRHSDCNCDYIQKYLTAAANQVA
ncbi:hypothetical protein PFICI_00435 [Pestalotiopsis fici W106-1]|uniref:BZIP domain-containing protein n=1 Tax=Pestalotiopsis fici (strain W106-1 / CGMCC3.15140) TaxID=1229662 RepID=W3XM93_PESFW|nr:uncharacterized protein PFICI_00435 [Pestalotiopsis fici W106-1]ETS86607.1 hypothetical protein PFICI_00435 [Pestalotiopsis fici W106-1]